MASVTRRRILPALLGPVLAAARRAPASSASVRASRTMSPPGPWSAAVVNRPLSGPRIVTVSVALTVTVPPGPGPRVLLLIWAPVGEQHTRRGHHNTAPRPPPLRSLGRTLQTMPLGKAPFGVVPARETVSVAVTVTLPPCPARGDAADLGAVGDSTRAWSPQYCPPPPLRWLLGAFVQKCRWARRYSGRCQIERARPRCHARSDGVTGRHRDIAPSPWPGCCC